MSGALDGVRVVELASIGPIPFCGLVLADMGADVIRIDKPAAVATADPARAPGTVLDRGRRSIGVDLKSTAGVELVLRFIESADVLIEGYRPGVAERLGFGPDVCLARNPRLVYGRLTGWGRDGPLSDRAGHDIDYTALAGALSAFGRAGGPPAPPLNLIGDFGGGGLLLAYGIACALVSASRTGEGQVVDTAMVDGTALLMAPFYAARQIGFWSDERGTNMLDTGSPYYDTYECADGAYVAVGAIEPQFYALLLEGLGLSDGDVPDRDDRAQWHELRSIFAARFKSHTRDEWAERFGALDACVAPILTLAEAPAHPHNVARDVFVEIDGVIHPAPAPRLGGTPGAITRPPCYAGQHTDEVLRELGIDSDEMARLRAGGTVG
ncbi:MAG TPA: CaiB/BaiF CoA-transferase family protein [Acidimicrobiales bacterium]